MTHLPSNIWKSKAIRTRLEQEARFESNHGRADKPHYWIIAPEGDSRRGEVVLSNFEESILDCEPHELQQDFARQIQKSVQKEAHFDGVWLVGWTHPPAGWDAIRVDGNNCWGRLIMIWLDEDADAQYTVESDIPFIQMVQAGVDNYITQAERAHHEYVAHYGKKAMKNDFGIKEDQTSKEALSTIH